MILMIVDPGSAEDSERSSVLLGGCHACIMILQKWQKWLSLVYLVNAVQTLC